MVKALVATLPKSGTHLLNVLLHNLGLSRHHGPVTEATIGLLSDDERLAKASAIRIAEMLDAAPDNSFVLHHIPYTKSLMWELAQRDVRAIALVRNPFDFVVSLAHHLRKDPAPDTPLGLSSHLMQHWICSGSEAVEGKAPEAPVAKRYLKMMYGWTTDERVLLLRFEDIVGPRGGGLFSDQLACALRLRDFLGLERSTGELARVVLSGYRPDIALFRRGQIGSWRDEMMPNTAEQIRLLYKNFIAAWGYTEFGDLVRHVGDRDNISADMDEAVAVLVNDLALLDAKLHRVTGGVKNEAEGEPSETLADTGD